MVTNLIIVALLIRVSDLARRPAPDDVETGVVASVPAERPGAEGER